MVNDFFITKFYKILMLFYVFVLLVKNVFEYCWLKKTKQKSDKLKTYEKMQKLVIKNVNKIVLYKIKYLQMKKIFGTKVFIFCKCRAKNFWCKGSNDLQTADRQSF